MSLRNLAFAVVGLTLLGGVGQAGASSSFAAKPKHQDPKKPTVAQSLDHSATAARDKKKEEKKEEKQSKTAIVAAGTKKKDKKHPSATLVLTDKKKDKKNVATTFAAAKKKSGKSRFAATDADVGLTLASMDSAFKPAQYSVGGSTHARQHCPRSRHGRMVA